MKKIFLFAFALLMAVGAQATEWHLENLKNGKTYTFQDGDVVTGTLEVNATLLIAHGATITLRDAHIRFPGGRWKVSESHAGLATKGNATILLEGENSVNPRGTYPPAIYVAKGWTLTIDAGAPGGYLFAYSYRGAGIGAGYKYYTNLVSSNISCGNIVIRGGEVYASSDEAAAIGGGFETSCGTITISGGRVEAHGGTNCPGIGTGRHIGSNGSSYWSECGKITISGGVVKAYGTTCAAAIGGGVNSRCGAIEITSGVDSIYAYSPSSYSIGKGAGVGSGGHSSFNGLTLFGTYYADGIETSPYIYPAPSTPQPEPEPVCDAPTNVQASDITSSSAKITWDANGTKRCNVYFKESGSEIYDVLSSVSNTIILDELKANTSYDVIIYQMCEIGTSNSSSPITFKTAQKPAPVATDEVYTVFEDGVLTYYFDSKRSTRSGIKEVYDPAGTDNRFTDYYDQVESAVIDPSMYGANLTSYANLFYGGSGPRGASYPLKNMTHIYGLDNLNWYEVSNISNMFCGCKSLTALDLSAFTTFSVTNMKGVFQSCSGLTELNIAMWDFSGVTNMQFMFNNCSSLETIYCNQNLGAQTTASEAFYGCSALMGGQGTAYSTDMVTSTYARPDGGSSNPGYFTSYTCKEPLNVQAVDVTPTSAVITWDIADEYQYGWLIQYRKASGGANKFVYTNSGNIQLTDLEPQTTYNVYISGECGTSMQSFDASLIFTTPSVQGIDEILDKKDADHQKFILDGHLVIKVGDKLYDAQGKELK